MKASRIPNCLSWISVLLLVLRISSAANLTFSQSSSTFDTFDFLEVTAKLEKSDAKNPFLDIAFTGTFSKGGITDRKEAEGFCDSPDGTIYRIRFMPATPGEYSYSVTYKEGGVATIHTGKFTASASHRKGPIRVDAKYPWHFIWEGTGEHYFFNGTTAFWLVGWRDERIITNCIDRLRNMKINRLRVLLSGAANIFWGEPVMTGENFTMMLRPWPAEAPKSFDQPKIDFTRFNIDYWQKWERMLRYARDHDVIISVILEISTHKAQPAAGSEDERRYIRYAVARLGAFSNITWDLGDDLDSFRNEEWTHETGTLLVGWDPYKHLATSHPAHREPQDRGSEWFGFTSIQDWGRNQHALMLEQRKLQMKAGRIIPQTNEEYGYEDHYPHWAPKPDADSAETLRRCAWEIAMAGAYGTAGESARRGVNIWPDLGGGWINGRGDDTMIMLKGYEHMVDFFTSFDWWKTEPHDELVNNGAYCLAQPGEIYAIYLPAEGKVTVKLEPGTYTASWFNAFTGERIPLDPIPGPDWTSPKTPGWLDWALLLTRKH